MRKHLASHVGISATGRHEWLGALDSKGYAYINWHSRTRLVSRIAWRLFVGDIPDGMGVLHRCDNRKCINIEHLFLGTPSDNMQDMWDKGRGRKTHMAGMKHPLAKLTDDDVRAISSNQGKLTARQFAEKYHIARGQIYAIIRRLSWRHIA